MSKEVSIRPPNCRIFLGNLASERTSKEELHRIFSKYGEIVEEIVMRRSFGFIQYDNPQSALAAIEGENGRTIGGMRVDINLADNREPRGPGAPKDKRRPSPPRQNNGRRRNRSPSPPVVDRNKRMAVGQSRPQGPVVCQLLYLGPGQKDYAARIEEDLVNEISNFGAECLLVERRIVQDQLSKAERRGLRYVLVMGRQNETNGTVALHIFRGGKSEAFNEIGTREAIDIIRREEQIIATNFLPPHQHYGINPNQPIPSGFPGQTYLPPVQLPYGGPMSQPLASGITAAQLVQNLDATTISRLLAALQQPGLQQAPIQSTLQQPSSLQQSTSVQSSLGMMQYPQVQTDPRTQYLQQSSSVPSSSLQGLQGTSQSVLQDPRVISNSQSVSLPNVQSSGSQYQQSSVGSSYGQVQSSTSQNMGTTQLPSNVANILNPRNTEMLQSLIAKLSPATTSQNQSYTSGQSHSANSLQSGSTNQSNYQQQGRSVSSGYSTGTKYDGVQQDVQTNLMMLQKNKQTGILPLPSQSSQSMPNSIPAYAPQQYNPQNYTNQSDQQRQYENGSKSYQ